MKSPGSVPDARPRAGQVSVDYFRQRHKTAYHSLQGLSPESEDDE